ELAALPFPVTLVLDDYHRVRERRCHELLTTFIEHQPPNLQLVLATRTDPPLRLGRLRARGELLELRAGDLRFSAAEAEAFFAATLGTALDPEVAAILVERTEGWPAGLYLAALSLRDGRDPRRFLEEFTGSQRHVAEYLTGELLEGQEEEVRRFLVRTSN